MKKWIKATLLVIFVSIAAITCSYTERTVQHLLVIATMIIVLKAVSGNEKDKKAGEAAL